MANGFRTAWKAGIELKNERNISAVHHNGDHNDPRTAGQADTTTTTGSTKGEIN